VRADARWKNGNATLNFWRIAENMSVIPAGEFRPMGRVASSPDAPNGHSRRPRLSTATMSGGNE
jgi:hypothetical protein